jgi:hypothetical protein
VLEPTGPVRLGGLALACVCFGLAILSIRVASLRRGLGALLCFGTIAMAAAALPLYPPWSVFAWALRFGDAPGAEPIFGTAWHAIAIPAHFLFLVGMYVAWRRARRNAKNTDAYGSARWATAREIEETGLLDGDGVFLGVVPERAGNKGTYLRHSGRHHVPGAPAALRTRATVLFGGSMRVAISRTDLPAPRSRRIRSRWARLVASGRPKRTPRRRAAACPARTRSWMRSRSNSAIAPSTWKKSLPAGGPCRGPGRGP